MSDSNSIATLERTSLNVYEADIFNCSPQSPAAGYDQYVAELDVAYVAGLADVAIPANRPGHAPGPQFRYEAEDPSGKPTSQ